MPSACQELPPVPLEISASFVTANIYDSKLFMPRLSKYMTMGSNDNNVLYPLAYA